MPIADTYVPLKTLGNGSTVDFSFNFPILAAANIRVYLEDVTTGVQTLQVSGTHFTLVFNDGTPGGTVTMLAAPSSGYYVIRAREIPRTQENTYKTAAGFQASVIQSALEKLTAMVQDVKEAIGRAVTMPIGSTATISFPSPVDDKILAWDGTSGTIKNTDGVPGPTGPTGPSGADGIFSEIASQAEAEAGSDNTKGMTALRTAQAVAALATGTWTDYSSTSTVTGWSSFASKSIKYLEIGKIVFVKFYIEGTSNGNTARFTVPTTNTGNIVWGAQGYSSDNGVALTAHPIYSLATSSNNVDCRKDGAENTWTTSGTKVVSGFFFYERA
jgi:hypothetical protein